jgi:hypothetical protein
MPRLRKKKRKKTPERNFKLCAHCSNLGNPRQIMETSSLTLGNPKFLYMPDLILKCMTMRNP